MAFATASSKPYKNFQDMLAGRSAKGVLRAGMLLWEATCRHREVAKDPDLGEKSRLPSLPQRHESRPASLPQETAA